MDATTWTGIVGSMFALLLVLALAWGSLRLLRRLSLGRSGSGGQGPQVLRAVNLGARERLVVVLHHDRELLLGVTPAGIQLLDARAAEPMPQAPDSGRDVDRTRGASL